MPTRGGVEHVFKRRVDFRKNPKNPIIRAAQKQRSSGEVRLREKAYCLEHRDSDWEFLDRGDPFLPCKGPLEHHEFPIVLQWVGESCAKVKDSNNV